jgi:hypothetical protein
MYIHSIFVIYFQIHRYNRIVNIHIDRDETIATLIIINKNLMYKSCFQFKYWMNLLIKHELIHIKA